MGCCCTALGPPAPSVDAALTEPGYGRTRGVSNMCGARGSCNSPDKVAIDDTLLELPGFLGFFAAGEERHERFLELISGGARIFSRHGN